MVTTSTATFGALLRQHRLTAGLTQELAERAGLSVRGIQSLERGGRIAPRPETVGLLADTLEPLNRRGFGVIPGRVEMEPRQSRPPFLGAIAPGVHLNPACCRAALLGMTRTIDRARLRSRIAENVLPLAIQVVSDLERKRRGLARPVKAALRWPGEGNAQGANEHDPALGAWTAEMRRPARPASWSDKVQRV